MKRNHTGFEIAVIGMSGRFPGATDINAFWNNLKNGVESIASLTDEQILQEGEDPAALKDPRYVKANSFISDKQYFDSEFFGIRSREARLLDPQIRIFLETCWKAVEDAGYNIQVCKDKIGLFAGGTSNMVWETYANRSNHDEYVDGLSSNHLSKVNFLCSRVAYLLDLQGPAIYMDTACSTSLVAIQRACMSLVLRECKMALAGGVTVRNFTHKGYLYQEGMFYSNDGHCRAYDAASTGTVAGEGTGAVLLKRMEDAIKDRDHIYGVILGSGINNDGAQKISYASPGIDGQYKAISKAIQMANVAPESISYIETQGTATQLGDPLEIEALNLALGKSKSKYCAIGSVKTNIGHIDVAAGAAGFIKAMLSLKYRQLVPSLHFNTPNPRANFNESPLYVNTSLKDWTSSTGPLRAGVSSFGIGGTNVHLVLQEAPTPEVSPAGRDCHVLTFSAKTPDALRRNIENFLSYITENAGQDFSDVAYTLQTGRAVFSFRKSLVCVDREHAIGLLASAEWKEAISQVSEEKVPAVAFVFEGDAGSSQYADACYVLYVKEPAYREEIESGIRILAEISGWGIDLDFLSGIRRLNANEAPGDRVFLFLREYAMARLMMKWGVRPDFLVSDNAHELVTACIGGVFPLKEAIALALKKEALLVAAGGEVVGALAISEYEEAIAKIAIRLPEIPMISAATGEKIADEDILKPGYWAEQLNRQEAFERSTMKPPGDRDMVLVKIGGENKLNGHGLTNGRLRIIDPHKSAVDKGNAQFLLLSALAELWLAGVSPDWSKFYEGESRHRVPLPTYSFEKTEYPVIVNVAGILRAERHDRDSQNKNTDVEQAYSHVAENRQELRKNIGKAVLEVWCDFLENEEIEADSNFFEAGGDSLMSLTLINRMKRLFGVKISIRDFFGHPTPELLSGFIYSAIGSEDFRRDAGAIPKSERRKYYGLSAVQKRMYFLFEFNKQSLAYNIPCFMQAEGEIDRQRLNAAFQQLIVRHESLRTSFRLVNGAVVQLVSDAVDFKIEYFSTSPDDAQSIIAAFVRPFDLGRAPLIRVGLVEIAAWDHVLMVDIHHIIADGISLNVLIKDFIALYKEETLAPITFNYRDFAEWQQRIHNSRSYNKQREFWIDQFTGNPGSLEIPTDYKRPSRLSFAGSSFQFSLSVLQTSQLKEIAERENVTIFMVLLSVFNIMLGKLGSREDVCVGIPAGGRQHADLEQVVGVFANTVVLRAFPRSEMTFAEFLADIKSRILACFDNQSYQYEELIDVLKIERDAGRNALFDFMFVFQNMEVAEFKLPGLVFRPYDYAQDVAKFDITLEAIESKGNILMRFEYNTLLFKSETMARFAAYYRKIVSAVLMDPAISIANISLLSAKEEHQLLNVFNTTRVEYPAERTIIDLFEDQARRAPGNIALQYGESCMSYAELNDLSGRIACYLQREMGVTAGDLVGIHLERDIDLIAVIMGIMKAGAAYVPIDPRFPRERVKSILEDAKLRVLMLRGSHMLPEAGICRLVDLDTELERIKDYAVTPLSGKAGGKDLAYVIYTSGSTGKPKGVMIEHHSVVNRILWMQEEYRLTASDVLLQKTPIIFDVSVWELFWWSVTGASLCLLPPGSEGDPKAIIAAIARHKVTTIHFVPAMLDAFLSVLHENFDYRQLESLRWVFTSGEALKPDQVRRFRKSIYRHCRSQLINLYGPTEATVDVSYYACCLDKEESIIPIGKPIHNTQLYVLDVSLQVCPIGVSGELCISGVGLSRGYLANSKLTSEKFVDHPYIQGDKLYKTGDLARWLPDGNVEYLGRIDSQVKIRGYRIELGEIESKLNAYEGITGSAVAMKEENADRYLVAYYISRRKVSVSELRDHLSTLLPAYMIPDFFVEIDTMPLTASGKLDYKALPKYEMNTIGVPSKPGNSMQKELVEIWAEVLGIPEDKIGTDTNFFEIGGNSLKIIKLTECINRKFNVEVSVADTFAYPVISAFSRFLKNESTMIPDSEIEDDVLQLNKTILIVRPE